MEIHYVDAFLILSQNTIVKGSIKNFQGVLHLLITLIEGDDFLKIKKSPCFDFIHYTDIRSSVGIPELWVNNVQLRSCRRCQE